jgi:hypothetical protein
MLSEYPEDEEMTKMVNGKMAEDHKFVKRVVEKKGGKVLNGTLGNGPPDIIFSDNLVSVNNMVSQLTDDNQNNPTYQDKSDTEDDFSILSHSNYKLLKNSPAPTQQVGPNFISDLTIVFLVDRLR